MATIKDAIRKSVKACVARGTLDQDASAAPIAMLETMADAIDTGGTEALRNVTPSSFLAYCKELGFTPGEQKAVKKKAEAGLASFRSESRVIRGGKAKTA